MDVENNVWASQDDGPRRKKAWPAMVDDEGELEEDDFFGDGEDDEGEMSDDEYGSSDDDDGDLLDDDEEGDDLFADDEKE
ncbi:MAG: hypothetical protein V3V20_03755 [Algisphaera sp.]